MSHLIPSSQITNKIGNYYCQGCIYHQKHIFKFHKSSSLSASLSSDMMASSFTLSLLPESNDKLSHLKAIYKKWFNNTITTVTSHRRGIEYQTKYQHLDCDLFNDHYQKKTLEKQAKRRSHHEKKAKAITMSAYYSRKFLGHNSIKQAAKVSQYLSPYNRTFYKVIKHLLLSRLIRTPEALPYILTRDHIIARDKHINPSVKKPKIPNQNDFTNFNPIPDELLAEDWKKTHQKLVCQQHAIDLAQEKANKKYQQQMDLIHDHDVKDLDEYNTVASKIKKLVSLLDTLDAQLRIVTHTFQERQLELI
ncbi:hypothetical protein RCL_jg4808.t1 [Rhizophagus clarus]|uniref:Uncharacterized protein n=1 Tax=Rhizophagus clarus TaxID=94130 RepID=A0A8H3MGE9_9GLOM|nr:hypothetical protein RCL_jg4808.t1 [Rhizophagus clarus]